MNSKKTKNEIALIKNRISFFEIKIKEEQLDDDSNYFKTKYRENAIERFNLEIEKCKLKITEIEAYEALEDSELKELLGRPM